MIDFSNWANLPVIWGVLIAVAVFMYVVLDGFDLGCGILFPFAPSSRCKDRIMNSIAPFWDGNETWLILGGGGLFAAFPLAYAIIMPAVYLPICMMLMGLILRGVAFEFRFKADLYQRPIWDTAFHAGSLLAAFMQGVVLGNVIKGIPVEGRHFAGAPLAWANGFSLTVGTALVFGYALLGSTWLVMKTTGDTQAWARRVARYVLAYVAIGMVIISIAMPLMSPRVAKLWFGSPMFWELLPLPLITIATFFTLWHDLTHSHWEYRPFLLTMLLFLLGYAGIGISLYPWIVPYHFTLAQAAAAPASQTIMLIGAVLMLPIILGYTAFCYYTFRGKTDSHAYYHG